MSIALVKISATDDRLIPLGLACLQSYLKSNDVPVKVFNFRGDRYSLPRAVLDPLIQSRPVNLIINHTDFPILMPLVDAILSGSEIDFNERIFPDLIEDFATRCFETPEKIQERYELAIDFVESTMGEIINKYSYVGFSVDYLNVVETFLASSFLKLYDSKIKIVWGGPAITQSFDAFKLMLSRGVCDGLVIGEGEKPTLEFASGKKLADIKGIISLKDGRSGEFVYKKGIQLDLDSLPTPDYTDIPLDTYFQIASVYRSRGCTNRCKFCGEWFLTGPKFRVRSVENVVNDIEIIVKKYKPEYVIFGESLINDDLEYFEKLCDAMIEKSFKVNFGTHFRANITPELAKKAFLAGFNDAWVGFEAFTDEELREMNKGATVNQNIETINNFTKAGVNVIAMLVVGFSDYNNEKLNCEAVVRTIKDFSQETYTTGSGVKKPLPIQWRPAPAFLVPGSFDYEESKLSRAFAWNLVNVSVSNEEALRLLAKELSEIPYEFERPITDKDLTRFITQIQEADRNAGFSIGGVTKYAINFLVKQRKQERRLRKIERVGVAAQRLKH